MVLDGLRKTLSDLCEIVGVCHCGSEVLDECRRLGPRIVLLDLSLPDVDGFQILRELKHELPEIAVIIVTMHCDRSVAGLALELGASGFVPKDAPMEQLLHAIQEVKQGHVFVSSEIATRSKATATQHHIATSRLTPRQQEILWLIGEGKSTSEISDVLHLCPDTISFHRARIRKSLMLGTEFELTRHAILMQLFRNSPSPDKP
jgi:DNA-binding NarL/FixJ family response regulator